MSTAQNIVRSLTLTIGIAACALATPIPAASDYTGTREVGSGVTATWGWSGTGNNGFSISWQVSDSGSGSTPWNYSYALAGADTAQSLSKGLSHLIIQLSENVPAAVYSFPSGSDADGPRVYDPTSNGNSNFGMPGSLFGIKWNCAAGCTNPTLAFASSQAPMWGSFYAISGKKPGQEVYAYNSGFGTVPVDGATDFTKWIVTPDTQTRAPGDITGAAVPEPSTFALSLLGGGGLLAAWYRRKRATA